VIAAAFDSTPQALDLSKIGGSDIAAIVGLSPWRSPWDVWDRIVHHRDGAPSSERMRWGHLLEPVVAAEWSRRFDDSCSDWTRGECQSFERWPWLRATVDYFDPHREWILEVKTTAAHGRHRWGASRSDDIPEHYACQVQAYLKALDYPIAHVAVLFGGQELEAFTVRRDRDVGDMLFEAAEQFWTEHVLTGEPPPPDGSPACRRYFERKRPSSKTVRPATDIETELAVELRDVKARISELGERKSEIENRILGELGETYGIEGAFGRITAGLSKGRETVDWKGVRGELVDLLAPEVLDDLISRNTRRSEGRRTMRTTYR